MKYYLIKIKIREEYSMIKKNEYKKKTRTERKNTYCYDLKI